MSTKLVLSKSLRELRFFFSQTGSESAAVKSFLNKEYKTIKDSNPHLPVLIRECSNISPALIMRFEKGVEVKKSLDKLTEEEISSVLTKAIN
ncbi:hypothetical protein CANARDRAFT_8939 [[Candida] arabinofermentans NRRL YB-2248]|uniref:Ribosomal protein/NADH dehydrogenase domain-containing protein n=1 Tax=[Candida] arabinofermentans NRRL YB-2248 TaxID=983967 RepID=A0A1E4SXT4_9ASCO|nr:hypothetical protein CANARDRAFT_8939 [[Candida] arabinofermentans NRRL YB-2248]